MEKLELQRIKKMEKQQQKIEKHKAIEMTLRQNIEYVYKKKIDAAIKDDGPRSVPFNTELADVFIGFKSFKHGGVAYEIRAGSVQINSLDQSLVYKSYWMKMINKLAYMQDVYEDPDPGYYSFFGINAGLLPIEDFEYLPDEELDTTKIYWGMYDKLVTDLAIDHCLWDYQADMRLKSESFDYQLPVEDILDLFLED